MDSRHGPTIDAYCTTFPAGLVFVYCVTECLAMGFVGLFNFIDTDVVGTGDKRICYHRLWRRGRVAVVVIEICITYSSDEDILHWASRLDD